MFVLHHNNDGHVPATEYKPCGAITPKMGAGLVFSSGVLALATGATKPEYICQKECSAAVSSGTIIPVIPVEDGAVYETVLSATCNAGLGSKVTLASDALRVTATTTDGVAELVYKAGNAAGDVVHVKF